MLKSMANKLTDMSKVRKVLNIHHQGKSKSFISHLSLSSNTVKKYIALYSVIKMSINDLKERSDSELEQLFSHNQQEVLTPKQQALYKFFPYVERQLKKTDITRQHMWKEYIAKHLYRFKSSQFGLYYRRWSQKVNPVMHMNHKSGDKMFIDYAGKTLEIVNLNSCEIKQVQFFVAIFGCQPIHLR